MRIKFFKDKVKKFSIYNSKKFGVFIIQLGKFGIEIMWRKGAVDLFGWKEKMFKQFNQNCKVCGKPLLVNSMSQIVFYHKQCRKFRIKSYQKHHQKEYVQLLATN